VFKAGRWVDDMVGLNEAIRPVLIRHVLDAAVRRYTELTDYLATAWLACRPSTWTSATE
jgi:hypothetical protein